MGLPKIDLPIYDLKLPSNGKIVTIRPFLVKEEKLLFMAIESEDEREIINVTKQVINNCLIDPTIDIEKLPFFDIDYLFIALRAKSVGENIEIKYSCNNILPDSKKCNHIFPAKIDISNCEIVKDDTIKSDIVIGSGYMIRMKYPNYTTMKTILDDDHDMNKKIRIIAGSIDSIVKGDEVHTTKDLTRDEIIKFVEDLTRQQYILLEEYVDNFPSFVIKSKTTCDKCNFEHNLVYSEFASFFV
jgi:hypothetical protein